jgi:hypothetical protein
MRVRCAAEPAAPLLIRPLPLSLASPLASRREAHTALDLKQGVDHLHSGVGLAKEMQQRIIK